MLIRKARKEDVSALQRIDLVIFADNPKYDSDLERNWSMTSIGKKYFTEMTSNSRKICLIAEVEGRIVGYISAVAKEFCYRLSKYLEIQDIGVIPEYRHQGIGSRLIRECLEVAKKRGFQRVYVNSYVRNLQAVRFYEENGFEKIDISLEKDI